MLRETTRRGLYGLVCASRTSELCVPVGVYVYCCSAWCTLTRMPLRCPKWAWGGVCVWLLLQFLLAVRLGEGVFLPAKTLNF